MKSKTKKRSPSVLIILLVALVLVVSVTLASIYTQTITDTRTFTLCNFVAKTEYSFAKDVNGTETTVISASDVASTYKDANGIRVSLDPTDNNYIENLRVSVKYQGRGVGLIRVHMVEEWSSTTTENSTSIRTVYPFERAIAYTLPTGKEYDKVNNSGNQAKWYDNREDDGCYYYATPVYATTTDDDWKEIKLITGLDTDKFDLNVIDASSTNLHVLAEADVVQVNRYPQYWSRTSLPWNNGVSLTDTALS